MDGSAFEHGAPDDRRPIRADRDRGSMYSREFGGVSRSSRRDDRARLGRAGWPPGRPRTVAPADSTSVSSTVCRSKVERLMTLSTSAVAVCCCSDSRSSLSSRVFSMAMTAWRRSSDQLDLLVGEWAHLLAVDADGADQLVLLEHRHDQKRPGARELGDRFIGAFRREVGNVDHLLRPARVDRGLGHRCSAAMPLFH